jgi:hypothetical protein
MPDTSTAYFYVSLVDFALGGSCAGGEASIMLFVSNARLPERWAGLMEFFCFTFR